MKPFRYLFYRLHQLIVSVSNGDDASFTTVLLMGMLIGLNITALLAIIYYITGQKFDVLVGSKSFIIIEYLALCFIFYLLFVRKGKDLDIIKSYEVETNRDKLIGKIFAIVYFIISIGLVIFSFYLMIMKNKGEL